MAPNPQPSHTRFCCTAETLTSAEEDVEAERKSLEMGGTKRCCLAHCQHVDSANVDLRSRFSDELPSRTSKALKRSYNTPRSRASSTFGKRKRQLVLKHIVKNSER